MAASVDEKRTKQLLEQIRRLPHNKRCVNCDKESIAGFGDVCEKFSSFVCHPCKSAHQSFSHRCKSVSLSNWTLAEVQKLSDQAGGGNAHARQTWLGKLEGKLVLRPDDPLDKVKAFVNEAYNYKKYWREPSGEQQVGSPGTTSPVAATESPVASRKDLAVPCTQQPRSLPHRVPPPVSATADFLDFAADFTAHAPPAVPASTSLVNNNNNSSSSSSTGFGFMNHQQGQENGSVTTHNDWEQFGAFVIAATPSPSSTPSSSSPPLPPSSQQHQQSAFGFISTPPPPHAVATSPSHDAFGSFMTASLAPPPMAMAPPPQARPAPPPMTLSRPLMEDPFAVLATPPQAAFGYMTQQQRPPRPPMQHMMTGPGSGFAPPQGGMAHPPMGMPMYMPQQQQQQQQAPHMVQMGGPPRGFTQNGGLPQPSYQPYKAQEPDPFASLDWRK